MAIFWFTDLNFFFFSLQEGFEIPAEVEDEEGELIEEETF